MIKCLLQEHNRKIITTVWLLRLGDRGFIKLLKNRVVGTLVELTILPAANKHWKKEKRTWQDFYTTSQIILAFWLGFTSDQLEDRRTDDVIDSMLLCVSSVIDHRRLQNVVRSSVTHSAITSCSTFWCHIWSFVQHTHGNMESNIFNLAYSVHHLRLCLDLLSSSFSVLTFTVLHQRA